MTEGHVQAWGGGGGVWVGGCGHSSRCTFCNINIEGWGMPMGASGTRVEESTGTGDRLRLAGRLGMGHATTSSTANARGPSAAQLAVEKTKESQTGSPQAAQLRQDSHAVGFSYNVTSGTYRQKLKKKGLCTPALAGGVVQDP